VKEFFAENIDNWLVDVSSRQPAREAEAKGAMQDMFEDVLYFNKSHTIKVLVWSTRVSMLASSKSQKN
jgi:hypothetical protein